MRINRKSFTDKPKTKKQREPIKRSTIVLLGAILLTGSYAALIEYGLWVLCHANKASQFVETNLLLGVLFLWVPVMIVWFVYDDVLKSEKRGY